MLNLRLKSRETGMEVCSSVLVSPKKSDRENWSRRCQQRQKDAGLGYFQLGIIIIHEGHTTVTDLVKYQKTINGTELIA